MRGTTERRVEVDSGGRGGDVLYIDANGTLRFCWEAAAFGYEIMVPRREDWEQQTGIALAARDETLALLAEAFLAKRCGGRGTYTIVEAPYAVVEIRP